MTTVSYRLRGFEGLNERLRKLGDGRTAGKIGGKATLEAIKILVAEIKTRTPVDTGGLQKSVVAIRRRSSSRNEVVAQVGFRRPAGSHAHLLEFGTVKMKAQPFIRPGFDAGKDGAVARIGYVVDQELKKEGK